MNRIGVDLHMHSYHSDGEWSPQALVDQGHRVGARLMALTDHDTLDGLEEGEHCAREKNIFWWNGVEISVSWGKYTIHVLGLGIDRSHADLYDHLFALRKKRWLRAQEMAQGLADVGIPGSLEGALRYCHGEKERISRTHFARFLVEVGRAKQVGDVFKHFLKEGKPGFVPTQWASLAEAISWIQDACGYAVLAHPGRYPMSRRKLLTLINEFQILGGKGLEVVSSSHSAQQVQDFHIIAQQYSLMGSVGSDFHSPKDSWRILGYNPPLMSCLSPIWSLHPDHEAINQELMCSERE